VAGSGGWRRPEIHACPQDWGMPADSLQKQIGPLGKPVMAL